jgi:hypothetical protein
MWITFCTANGSVLLIAGNAKKGHPPGNQDWLSHPQVYRRQHQDDFFDVLEVKITDLFEDMCIIDRSAAPGDLDMAPTFERREQHEQICRAVALVPVGPRVPPPKNF